MEILLDNTFIPQEEASIPLQDRGLLFGDGLYTTLLVSEGEIYFLEEHLERLRKQAALLHIIPPPFIKELYFELLERNEALTGTWRLKIFITGGEGSEMSLPKREWGHCFAMLDPFTPPPYAPLDVALFPMPIAVPHAHFKSLSSLHRLYVANYAAEQNKDDAITTTGEGFLLEASYGNLFWICNKTLYTPHPELPLYFGMTIEKVVLVAKRLGLRVQYVKQSLENVPEEAQVFRTNTLRGIRPITLIDKRAFFRVEELEGQLLALYEELKSEKKETRRLSVNPLVS